MDVLISVLSFVGIFSALVFIHEMGHFLVARQFGVRVETFSIGFGRSLWSYTDSKGTVWRVAAIPLGGYVKFFGDSSGASNKDAGIDGLSDEEKAVCFHFKPLAQRTLIVAAGPFANLALAVVLMAGLFSIHGQPYTPAVVGSVVEGSAAAEAGMKAGDEFVRIDDFKTNSFEDVANYVLVHAGKNVQIEVLRDGQHILLMAAIKTVEVESRFGRIEKIGRLGVSRTGTRVLERNPAEALYYATIRTGDLITLTLKTMAQVINGTRSFKELGGPLKIGEISGEVAQISFTAIILFMAMLSINLGIINLFPVPLLDGGHLLYYLVEALMGKPMGDRAQEYGFRMGLAAILTLMVVVTWNDVVSLIGRMGAS